MLLGKEEKIYTLCSKLGHMKKYEVVPIVRTVMVLN